MDWQPIQKPAEMAENRLLDGILSGHFSINSTLPGERELAEQIGVTRPTLREALQRLARDGWLDIQHGKPTRVQDYWHEGSMAVLSVLAQSPAHQPPDFVANLLELRVLLAPAYTCQAVQAASSEIANSLEKYVEIEDIPSVFANADWELHYLLTQRATNPVFRLLLNSFHTIYVLLGEKYFTYPECRTSSRKFYRELRDCALSKSAEKAGNLTRRVMEESLALWQKMKKENS